MLSIITCMSWKSYFWSSNRKWLYYSNLPSIDSGYSIN